MASKQMLLSAVAASMALLVFLPALASATDHVVGDSQGWTLGFDYAAWAESKHFTVGDTLGTRTQLDPSKTFYYRPRFGFLIKF
jgi:hypothetical protein